MYKTQQCFLLVFKANIKPTALFQWILLLWSVPTAYDTVVRQQAALGRQRRAPASLGGLRAGPQWSCFNKRPASWSPVRNSWVVVTFSIGPLAFIKCKQPTSNPFPFYSQSPNGLNCIQGVEPDRFALTPGTGFENGLISWHWDAGQ